MQESCWEKRRREGQADLFRFPSFARTNQAEERLDGDAELAKMVYERLGRRMIECGTGAG